jgi:putative membrane protein
MIMKKAILIFLLSLGGMAVRAQIPQPDPDTTAKHFLIVASIGNLQEISAAHLAVQKGKSADVRSFGQMMIDDHGKAEQQLLALAKTRGISLPAAATGGIQPDLKLKNAAEHFDQLYVHAMVVNHASTVQTFENYAITGKDPAVKAFAQQLLPTLKAHLAKIKAIDRQFKEPSK